MKKTALLLCLLLTACYTPRVGGVPKPDRVLAQATVSGPPLSVLECVEGQLVGDGRGPAVRYHLPHTSVYYLTWEQGGQIITGSRYTARGGSTLVEAFGVADRDARRTVEAARKCDAP